MKTEGKEERRRKERKEVLYSTSAEKETGRGLVSATELIMVIDGYLRGERQGKNRRRKRIRKGN